MNQNNFNLLTMFRLRVISSHTDQAIYTNWINIYKQCFYI